MKRKKRNPLRRTTIKDGSFPFAPNILLKVAGYYKRPHPMNDWIKEDSDGRFHLAKYDVGFINLHYDMNGDECNHYSIPMPLRCERERNRLMAIGRNLKIKYDKSREERENQEEQQKDDSQRTVNFQFITT